MVMSDMHHAFNFTGIVLHVPRISLLAPGVVDLSFKTESLYIHGQHEIHSFVHGPISRTAIATGPIPWRQTSNVLIIQGICIGSIEEVADVIICILLATVFSEAEVSSVVRTTAW